MSTFKWVTTIWLGIIGIIPVLRVGKPRPAITPVAAAVGIIEVAAFIGWMWVVLP